jgi:hypothetical protein
MDLFNRWLVTLLALGVALACAFVMIASGGLLAAGSLDDVPALAAWAVQLRDSGSPVVVGGALAGMLAALGLVVAEWVVPARGRRMLIQRDKLGSVTVSMPGLKRLANFVISDVSGVETVVSDAHPTREGVAIQCRVVVQPEANTPELAQAIRERLEIAVRSHTGRAVTQVDVHAQVGSNGFKKRVR